MGAETRENIVRTGECILSVVFLCCAPVLCSIANLCISLSPCVRGERMIGECVIRLIINYESSIVLVFHELGAHSRKEHYTIVCEP